jgi:hypothetical protein
MPSGCCKCSWVIESLGSEIVIWLLKMSLLLLFEPEGPQIRVPFPSCLSLVPDLSTGNVSLFAEFFSQRVLMSLLCKSMAFVLPNAFPCDRRREFLQNQQGTEDTTLSTWCSPLCFLRPYFGSALVFICVSHSRHYYRCVRQ